MSAPPNASRELINLTDHQLDLGKTRAGRPMAIDDGVDAAFSARNTGEMSTLHEQIDFAELLRRLFRRRWLIGLTTLAITSLAVIVVSMLPARYAATAQVMIDARPARVTDIKAVLPELTLDKETVQSEIQVIRSRRLAKIVVDKLDLVQYPFFNPDLEPTRLTLPRLTQLLGSVEPYLVWFKSFLGGDQESGADSERVRLKAVDLFIDSLDIAPEGQSRVINITAEAESPALSAAMANALSTLYLDDQIEAKASASLRASVWLRERLEQLRPEVEKSEQAVEDYRRDAGLVEGQQSNVVEQQLSELNTQLIIAQAKRSETGARLKQVQTLVDKPEQIETVPDVLASPVVQNMLSQSAKLTRQMAELSSDLGRNHPRMLGLRAEIEGLRSGLALHVKQIVASLQNELEAAIGREEILSGKLEEIKNSASQLKDREVGLRALERDAKASRTLYEQILKRYKETATEAEVSLEPDARLVSEADQPLRPSFPKKKLTVLITFAGSLSLGIFVALLLEYLDRGLRSSEQIRRLTGLRTLANVPLTSSLETGIFNRRRSKLESPIAHVLDRPRSAFGEALRTLHTGLVTTEYGDALKVVLFTSAQAGEGKSTTALSLGHLLAMHGQKVVVVDADIRRPQIAQRLNLAPSPGLIEVINGECRLEDAICKYERSGLYALPAGGPARSPQQAPSLRPLIFDELSANFDMVLVDAPPVLAVSDAQLLCRLVDKTVYIIRWGKTPSETAIAGLKQLHESGADIAGVVLNQVDVRKNANYGYGDAAYFNKKDMSYYSS